MKCIVLRDLTLAVSRDEQLNGIPPARSKHQADRLNHRNSLSSHREAAGEAGGLAANRPIFLAGGPLSKTAVQSSPLKRQRAA